MFWLESDTFHEDPVWDVLAVGKLALVDALQSACCRLKSRAAHNKSDGWLTKQAALEECHGRRKILDLLCTSVLEQPPLVHREGDSCPCLGDHPWIAGYAYRIHGFLKRNPSKKEYERNQAQKADLRDARLKAQVYARDGGCCRYCHSGPLSAKAGRAKDRRRHLTYDHVDPDQPAGDDGTNLVVACARCNEAKGHRTPDEADMVLLHVPSPEQAAAWRARDRVLYEPGEAPEPAANQRPISDESATDQRSDHEHDQKPISDPISDPDAEQIAEPTPPVRPQPINNTSDQRSDQGAEGSGLGRGGHPGPDRVTPAPSAGQPARSPQYPDIYHRRSRSAPLPEYLWPPGSIPASPAHDEHQPREAQHDHGG